MSASTLEKVAEPDFSPALTSFITEWKDKPGSLIMILHRLQQEFGFLPRPAILKLSRVINLPLAKIYGVVTFYHYFKLTKPGRHNIQVCMGTACYLKGGEDIIEELENMLGIGVNQVTEDGEFSIESVRCVGCCGLAPVAVCGTEVFGKIVPDKLPEILAKLRAQA
ncbi:MAG: NAD(P)H-dependent oxidoreductase subunit E [Spirochaetales bacterium]